MTSTNLSEPLCQHHDHEARRVSPPIDPPQPRALCPARPALLKSMSSGNHSHEHGHGHGHSHSHSHELGHGDEQEAAIMQVGVIASENNSSGSCSCSSLCFVSSTLFPAAAHFTHHLSTDVLFRARQSLSQNPRRERACSRMPMTPQSVRKHSLSTPNHISH